ncbi:MAG: DNA/RNA nuclease SfsA [Spirochaetia bacterium]|jgi:sugar fermentation stimulation protein A|nr:DNA/RNA nuclease SfsA [Spirochaetia bacterium]
MQFFRNDLEGLFLERPNRFIVIAETSTGIIRAHCPNPGRLIEILTPGRKLIFQKSDNPKRKTPYSLVAAFYKDKVIPLNSVMANRAASELVIPLLFPSADKITPEQTFGKSRFDFLIQEEKNKTYLEVKSCTLVENGRAMFPDAPTKRGTKHINELMEIEKNEQNTKGKVLFIITHEDAKVFTPNMHTDPYFAFTLKKALKNIQVDFASIKCNANGKASLVNLKVPVDIEPVKFAEDDSGIYMVIVKLEQDKTIPTGKLEYSKYKSGYYLYAGSAKTNLSKRIKRHKNRTKKTFHWHIDYLTASADEVKTFGIYTDRFSECDIAQGLQGIGGRGILNFGSTDCKCSSHLYYFKNNPVRNIDFLELLHYFRHSYNKK